MNPAARLFLRLSVLALALLCSLRGQSNYATPYAFTTLTSGIVGSNIAVDNSGNLYMVVNQDGLISKITRTGQVSTLARVPPLEGVSVLSIPTGLAVDGAGNVFVAAAGTNMIMKINSAGVVTRFAGNTSRNPDLPPLKDIFGGPGTAPDPSNRGYVDGPATGARFDFPQGVAVDNAGNVYVADSSNRTVRKISPVGTVTTLAGNPANAPFTVDGFGSAASFGSMNGIAVDSSGNLYITEPGTSCIRKVTQAGVVTTVAGEPYLPGSADGKARAARFNSPESIAVDSVGNLFVADTGNGTIRKIAPDGTVTTLAGIPGFGAVDADGTGSAARLGDPYGIAVDASGILYVTDFASGVGAIRKGALAPSMAPAIIAQPVSHTIVAGGTVVLSVAASGSNLRYQWRKDGADLPGSAGETLLLTGVSGAEVGSYSVVVSSDTGAVESAPATLTLASAASRSRLVNLSIRTGAGTGDRTLIAGFVVGGTGVQPMLVRGIGPSLTPLGVSNALIDPQIILFDSAGRQIDQNDNWGGGAALATIFASLGALQLPAASLDSALLNSLPAGPYTVHAISDASTGVALVEVYDAGATGGSARLVNVSARSDVGLGDAILIAGFVIAGRSSMTVLLRGVGPTLGQLGVSSALADPRLELYDSAGRMIFDNDDWGGDSTLSGIFGVIGAFALPTTSKDAAILITLPPGVFTAHLSGVGATTGVALLEAYEVQ